MRVSSRVFSRTHIIYLARRRTLNHPRGGKNILPDVAQVEGAPAPRQWAPAVQAVGPSVGLTSS